MGLSQEQIAELIGPTKSKYKLEPVGKYWKSSRDTKHVTWCDISGPCTSRNCRAPTYIKVLGAYKCATHVIIQLSELLDPPLPGEL